MVVPESAVGHIIRGVHIDYLIVLTKQFIYMRLDHSFLDGIIAPGEGHIPVSAIFVLKRRHFLFR